MNDALSTDTLLEIIRAALRAHDWRGVEAGLRVLAVQSPHDAEAIFDVINVMAKR